MVEIRQLIPKCDFKGLHLLKIIKALKNNGKKRRDSWKSKSTL